MDTILFMAARGNLRLIHTPGHRQQNALGTGVEVPGRAFEFRNGRLEVAADDEETLEWLRGHRLFGDGHDGFFEVTPPAPEPDDEILAITIASAELDDEKIEEILKSEREGHGRPLVIKTAEAALEHNARVREALEKKQAAGAGGDGEGGE